MSITKQFDEIESHEMAAQVNVASSLRVASRIVKDHPTVRELVRQLRRPGIPERILERVLMLTRQVTDPRYEDPHDTALMIYAWLLYQHDPDLAIMASAEICQVPNLWWASKIATKILDRRIEQNEMAGTVSKLVTVNANAGDKLLVTGARYIIAPLRILGRPLRQARVNR